MELTEKELRERGIRRKSEEVQEEARLFALHALVSLPEGRRVTQPLEEFSVGETAVLEEGGVDLSPPEAEETNVLARTAARHAAMLATALTTAEAADLLGVGESRVRQRLAERTLYGVKVGRENRLPAFQFEGGEEVPEVARVLRQIDSSVHPVALLNWFTLSDPDLYVEGEESAISPKEWLLSGGPPEPLCSLAEDL